MSTEITVSNPDLLTVRMTREEALETCAALKRFTIAVLDNYKSVEHHTRQAETAAEQAREKAFRLKENDNWKLVDSSYRSWEEFCKNEFNATCRQVIDRMVTHYEVNRALPQEVRVTKQLHATVLAQVPDNQKADVLKAARAMAPRNKITGQKQVSARLLTQVAEERGIQIKGIPEGARPKKPVETKVISDVPPPKPTLSPADKIGFLTSELESIQKRLERLQTMVYESVEEELRQIRLFLESLLKGVTERLVQVKG